jgi:putative sigma-54 modulation protein
MNFMIYTTNFEGVKLDIQTVNAKVTGEIQLRIKRMIRRLKRHISEINWINISLRKNAKQSTNKRTVGVRVGIPDNDVFASASGPQWKLLLKRIEGRLEKQLRKRKAVGSANAQPTGKI